jgi:hypothetical protein
MELGLQVPDFALPGGTAALRVELAEAVRAADDAGFAYLAVSAKPFSSKHFTAERLLNSPQRPPIMVGGAPRPFTTTWTSVRPGRRPASFSPRRNGCTGLAGRP